MAFVLKVGEYPGSSQDGLTYRRMHRHSGAAPTPRNWTPSPRTTVYNAMSIHSSDWLKAPWNKKEWMRVLCAGAKTRGKEEAATPVPESRQAQTVCIKTVKSDLLSLLADSCWARYLQTFSDPNLTITLGRRHPYPHFTDGETEAQGG